MQGLSCISTWMCDGTWDRVSPIFTQALEAQRIFMGLSVIYTIPIQACQYGVFDLVAPNSDRSRGMSRAPPKLSSPSW